MTITNVELHLDGPDLIDDPELRRGLVHLWQAEAEPAGLDVDTMECLGAGQQLPDQSWSLAALTSGGEQYVVRALRRRGRPRGRPHPRRALALLTRLAPRRRRRSAVLAEAGAPSEAGRRST